MELRAILQGKKSFNLSDFRRAKKYIIWIFLISWTFGFIAFNIGNFDNEIQKALSTLMFGLLPALLAIVINKKEGGNWKDLKFVRPSLKGVILAFIIPILYLGITFFIEIALNYRAAVNFTETIGSAEFITGFIIGYPIMLILILGEEIGWRGYLQEKLIRSLGGVKGIVVLGIVWGLWHLPIALKGYNLPNHPYIEAFVTYPLLGIALSFMIAYIGFNKYSIFIGAIFHASNNHFGGSLLQTTQTTNELGHAFVFIFFYLLIIIVFGFLFSKKVKSNNPEISVK